MDYGSAAIGRKHILAPPEGICSIVCAVHTEIDGLAIHFLHLRFAAFAAMPLIVTLAGPDRSSKFQKVIEPLPIDRGRRQGGPRLSTWCVVHCPVWFLGQTPTAGLGVDRIARSWAA